MRDGNLFLHLPVTETRFLRTVKHFVFLVTLVTSSACKTAVHFAQCVREVRVMVLNLTPQDSELAVFERSKNKIGLNRDLHEIANNLVLYTWLAWIKQHMVTVFDN